MKHKNRVIGYLNDIRNQLTSDINGTDTGNAALERAKMIEASIMEQRREGAHAGVPHGADSARKILVVSDNHGKTDHLRQIIEREKPDLMYHLGDSQSNPKEMARWIRIPFSMVAGNCDRWNDDMPADRLVTMGNKKVLLTHGHRDGVNPGDLRSLKHRAKNLGADLVFYGHTHVPDVDYDYGITSICPGSTDYPRQRTRACTYLIVQVDEAGELRTEIRQLD